MFKIDIDLDLLEQYVSKAKVGDLKAKEKIIDLYMPFIIKTSSSFFINGMSKDDIKQEIITSLFVAINRYKGHNSFFWYAIKTMQNNLCSLLRKNKRNRDFISYDTLFNIQNDEEIERNILNSEEVFYLMNCISKLDKKESEIIHKTFFLNYSYDRLMEEMKLKYSSIACKKSRTIKKLKKSMEENY